MSSAMPFVLPRFDSFVLLLLVVPLASGEAAPHDPSPNAVRVMSFNVRYGTADDGDHHWDLRKELVVRVARDLDADLIGTQEILPFQAEFLQDQLVQYEYVGRSRELDNEQGEQCGIFFRRSRFIELERGSFWLSDVPESPGSKGWDAALPRMVTWLKLFDRAQERVLVLLNTHFDHQGSEARERSARLLRNYAKRFAADYPLMITGDFNAAEDSAPYRALLANVSGDESPVVDTYRQVHRQREGNEGTFNGFQGLETGPRIDWILASRHWHVISAQIVRYADGNLYPSDHFPVFSELTY